MALQKQSVPINFASGLETKTDDKQVQPGKFLALANSIFDKGGMLLKRNGYGPLVELPDTTSTFLTTFNGNLTAIGSSFQAFSDGSNAWVNKGDTTPVRLSTLPLIRSNTNQSYADIAVAANGLVCTVYTDNVPVSGSAVATYKYVIADSVTGQNITAPALIPIASGTIPQAPRVFALGKYFVIVFNNLITGTNHLSYVAISSLQPTQVATVVSLSTQYTATTKGSFDGVVTNNTLYLVWNASDIGGGVRALYLTSTLGASGSVLFAAGHPATIISIAADTSGTTPVLRSSFYDSVSQNGYTIAFSQALVSILTATLIVAATALANITSTANNGTAKIFYEVTNAYTYDSAIPTNFIKTLNVTQAGVVGTTTTLIRSVGLASKAFIISGVSYFLSVYSSVFQPSYFLINQEGNVVAKLAYSNSGGYATTGLPNAQVSGTSTVQMPYLMKDQIQAISKEQGDSHPAGIYSQTGINLATFVLNGPVSSSVEIGNNLNVQGGFLLAYDGYSVVENGFFLWPDSVEATGSSTGGFMGGVQYFYIATYEWSDNQGNVFRSAPSIPVEADLTGFFPSSVCSVSVNVPTLRLTYKINNPVKIVLYRWSVNQQTYYQTTSVTVPSLNNTAVDYITIVDTNNDDSILGNNILYTTGGVIENIAPPASDTVALFQSRVFLVDAEDKNLMWFSKQIIESTPVEMSDLLTLFVAPTTSAQGSTGPITALSAMDDKLIIFKKDAIYYITGIGPDNTGANNQFSEPTFITATVGSENQQSIVFIPEGLIFQSDKGMWLLGRNLSTNYIGAPVEAYTTNALVQSAVNVPGTNQVRFTLDSGITLMYDYYYGQWGTFTNVPAISSTLYQGLHTYLNSRGAVFQETIGTYLDNTNPVLMNFTTSWYNLAGMQGFERAYFFYLLGSYISPHKLSVSIAYDYNPSPTQVSIITPTNATPNYGGLAQWGSSPSWGGEQSLEQWRVFLRQQKCQAFQISIQESYDSTIGQPAGAGFTLSGVDLVVGIKSGYPRLRAANSVG